MKDRIMQSRHTKTAVEAARKVLREQKVAGVANKATLKAPRLSLKRPVQPVVPVVTTKRDSATGRAVVTVKVNVQLEEPVMYAERRSREKNL